MLDERDISLYSQNIGRWKTASDTEKIRVRRSRARIFLLPYKIRFHLLRLSKTISYIVNFLSFTEKVDICKRLC